MAKPGEAIERGDELAPLVTLVGQGAASKRRQLVEAAAALAGLLDPLPFHQLLALQTVQQRVEGGHVKLQLVFRLGVDELRELVAVAGAPVEESEDDHLGAALLNVCDRHRCRVYMYG